MNLKHAIAALATAAIMMPAVGTAEAHKYKNDRLETKQYSNFDRRDDDFVPRRFRRDRERHAAVWTPRIDLRIERQMRRIRRGVRRGQLTRWETFRLRSRMFAIRSVRQFARLDGKVTGQERRELMRMLNNNSQLIRVLKRNGRERAVWNIWF